MLFRSLAVGATLAFLTSIAEAQVAEVISDGTPATLRLTSGKTVTDAKGRRIENAGWNGNGALSIRFTGKLTKTSTGDYVVEGEVLGVTNPASQGSAGPVIVETGGQPTAVDLQRSGLDPGGRLQATVTGGNATVTVGGNYCDVSVGGQGNQVDLQGRGNAGTGLQDSGGDVRLGGRGNSWQGGAGWKVRN